MLTAPQATSFARIALSNVAMRYPYKLDQLLTAPADLAPPDSLHPLFWGSYDWHSCVHMHWTLVRLLRRVPQHPLAAASRAHLDVRLTPAAAAGELATLRGPQRQTFERPYGWGWLLKLAAELELAAQADPQAVAWRDALRPLAQTFAERFLQFLPRADYPTRAGTHGNSAFALRLALDWCDAVGHPALRRAIVERTHRWFSADRRYPADYEPGGDDFLSAGLIEAALMCRILGDCSFGEWWEQFCPVADVLAHWFTPVRVSDGSDARIVHLHGVNLCRAWCWAALRGALPASLPLDEAIEVHLQASLPAAAVGDYVGTHWLASFAVLALDDTD